MESNDENNVASMAKLELALGQQQQALVELSREAKNCQERLDGHDRLLDKVERRQRAETERLDGHEKRIMTLEAG